MMHTDGDKLTCDLDLWPFPLECLSFMALRSFHTKTVQPSVQTLWHIFGHYLALWPQNWSSTLHVTISMLGFQELVVLELEW